jgi:hypothetical protein
VRSGGGAEVHVLGAAVGQTEPAQRVGPQAPHPAGVRPPGGEDPPPHVRAAGCVHDCRDAGGAREGRRELLPVRAANPGSAAAALCGERRGNGDDVGGEPGGGRRPPLDAPHELLSKLRQPVARDGRRGHHRHTVEAVLVEQAAEVA